MEEHRYQSQKRTYTEFLEHEDSSDGRHIGRNSSTASSSAPSTVWTRVADLCARCKTIDLVGLFDEKSESIRTDLGKFVIDLESSVEQLKAANCSLCQLFASVAPSDLDEDGSPRISNYHLRAFSGYRTFGNFTAREFPFPDTTLLAVVRFEITAPNPGNDGAYGKIANSWRETGLLSSVSTDAFQVRGILRRRVCGEVA